MRDIVGVILAAGEGIRMKSAVPKVLHKVCGKPMLKYMLDVMEQLKVKEILVVLGHKAEKVKQFVKTDSKIKTVIQPKLLGSADALKQTKKYLSKFNGDVLIVYGDTPLIDCQSLKKIIQLHRKSAASCTLLTAVLKNPRGFGRILRDEDNRIVKIVEEQDADTYEQAIDEINVGAYCFKSGKLFSVLEEIKQNNVKEEFYLTDAIGILNHRKARIESVSTQDEQEALGVNSRYDLACANSIVNKRNIEYLLSNGVTVIDLATTYVYGEAEIGRDTIIYPHTVVEGKVKIGKSCRIGPFAHLRPGTILEDNVAIGNFVEVVRSHVGTGTKIKHHSYIGDSTIGRRVNIGAGTIIANYDGEKKRHTFINDEAFIGTGTILIAPVKVGKKAVTGAGSVVCKNKNVPSGVTVVGVPARVLKKRKKQRKKK